MIELENPNFFSSIYALSLKSRSIISISGESGTGKTTLGLQLISEVLINQMSEESKCVWIQASEQFPKKRLLSLFKSTPDQIHYLLNNIYVYPVKSPFSNYREQSKFFNELGTCLLPTNVRFIVIDNISHHLRFGASSCLDIKKKTILLDQFFTSQLLPLIMRCLREKIALILIHEVSFNPNLERNQPFFNKLYSRIQEVSITLSKIFNSKLNKMEIKASDLFTRTFAYEIRDTGLSRI
ncbi:MAG: hypothetical protein ACFE96_02860 [Candidatus Hermodarchaeota archaeon]